MRRCIALLVIGSSSSNLIEEGVLLVVEIRNTRLQVDTQGLRQQKCQRFRGNSDASRRNSSDSGSEDDDDLVAAMPCSGQCRPDSERLKTPT